MNNLQKHRDFFAQSFASDPNFRNVVLDSLERDPSIYFVLNDTMKDDREILEAAIKQRSDCYIFASERLRAIPEIYLAAVASAGEQEVNEIWEFPEVWHEATPPGILSDLNVQLKAMVVSPVTVNHAADTVRSNPIYLFALAETHGVVAMAGSMTGELRDKFIPDYETRQANLSEEEAQSIYDALKASLEKDGLDQVVHTPENVESKPFKL